MNYERIYEKLIEKRKLNPATEGFINKHHIKPRHAGGTDDEDNLVVLTYKEHIFAHKLLYRIYGNYLDMYAYLLMSSKDEEAMRLIKSEAGKIGGKRTQELYGPRIQSAGGKIGGKIAGQKNKESGHIYKIAKENQKLATECKKLSGKFVYIDPEGEEFYTVDKMLEKYPEATTSKLYSRCRKGNMGFSMREKTPEDIEKCNQLKEMLKLNKE